MYQQSFPFYSEPYFVFTGRDDEVEALKVARPKNLVVSFKHLISTVWTKQLWKMTKELNYSPSSIIFDSGAFSFFNDSTDIGWWEVIDHYYDEGQTHEEVARQLIHEFCHTTWYDLSDMQPILQYLFMIHVSGVDYAFNLDIIGENSTSFEIFKLMDTMHPGKIIPVFSAVDYSGSSPTQEKDYSTLHEYAKVSDYIGIGGMATKEMKKVAKKEKIKWINDITKQYPYKKFHLLGCLDSYVLDRVEGVYSSDGTAWIDKHGQWKRSGELNKVTQSVKNIIRLQNKLTS